MFSNKQGELMCKLVNGIVLPKDKSKQFLERHGKSGQSYSDISEILKERKIRDIGGDMVGKILRGQSATTKEVVDELDKIYSAFEKINDKTKKLREKVGV